MKKDRICQYCNETFLDVEGRVHSNHVRWCKKNPNDTTSNLKISATKVAEKRYGRLIEYSVLCNKCNKSFSVKENEFSFPKKDKYFCTIKCANGKIQTKEANESRRIKNAIASKLLWQDPLYIAKMDIGRRPRFTSKAEVLIREHFINKFDDEWTFGGNVKHNDLMMSRDLFSKKLKICFEYDGVWHFKDIHGQLQRKQEKDKALEEWCIDKGWRLILMSESFHHSHKEDFVYIIEDAIYNKQDQIIKFGKEYLA